jgi:hypothetical protein
MHTLHLVGGIWITVTAARSVGDTVQTSHAHVPYRTNALTTGKLLPIQPAKPLDITGSVLAQRQSLQCHRDGPLPEVLMLESVVLNLHCQVAKLHLHTVGITGIKSTADMARRTQHTHSRRIEVDR